MALQDAYYDHHPLVMIDRPLAITGVVAPDTRTVGYRIAALHGLPYVDLRRSMEHEAGTSLADLSRNSSELEFLRAEETALRRAVEARPPSVIVVPDRALSKRSNVRLLRRQTFLVALTYSVSDCYQRLRREFPDHAPQWIAEAAGPGELEALYRQWCQRFRHAQIEQPMQGLRAAEAVNPLIERLQANGRSGFALN